MFENTVGLMEEVRSKFAYVDSCPVQGKRIFFENAGGALTLNSVVKVSNDFAGIPDNQGRANPGAKRLMDVIAKSKSDVRLLFNAKGGEVFVGESGTELLFRLVRSAIVAAPEGSAVLGSTLEHPATRSACARWAEIMKRPYTAVAHDNATGTVDVAAYAAAITPNTKVATILHTSPVTGMGVDVKAIAKTIRNISPDCIIIVDGIQHAAHGHIDIEAYGIDGYVISPYKVFSRHGYGMAWVSERLADIPHEQLIDSPQRTWEFGTRDTGAYATMSEVVRYLEWLGGRVSSETEPRAQIEAAARAMFEHEQGLTQLAINGNDKVAGLAAMEGITLIGGTNNAHREGLVSFVAHQKEAAEIVEELNNRGIRTHTRKADHYSGNILKPLGLDACVRVSFCHYNSQEEILAFLRAMAEILDL